MEDIFVQPTKNGWKVLYKESVLRFFKSKKLLEIYLLDSAWLDARERYYTYRKNQYV